MSGSISESEVGVEDDKNKGREREREPGLCHVVCFDGGDWAPVSPLTLSPRSKLDEYHWEPCRRWKLDDVDWV